MVDFDLGVNSHLEEIPWQNLSDHNLNRHRTSREMVNSGEIEGFTEILEMKP